MGESSGMGAGGKVYGRCVVLVCLTGLLFRRKSPLCSSVSTNIMTGCRGKLKSGNKRRY